MAPHSREATREATPREAALPVAIALRTARLWLHAELRLGHSAPDQVSIRPAAAEEAPPLLPTARGAIQHAQEFRREIDIVDLTVLDVANALAVADGRGQHRAQHRPATSDVPVERSAQLPERHRTLGSRNSRVQHQKRAHHQRARNVCPLGIAIGGCEKKQSGCECHKADMNARAATRRSYAPHANHIQIASCTTSA